MWNSMIVNLSGMKIKIKQTWKNMEFLFRKDVKWKKIELNTDINIIALQNWIDTIVSNSWGHNCAERVYSIIETGQDIKVTRFKDKRSQENEDSYIIRVSVEGDVPGTQPAENLYDVANALSWVSSHQNSLQKQYKMMLQIPTMLKELESSLG